MYPDSMTFEMLEIYPSLTSGEYHFQENVMYPFPRTVFPNVSKPYPSNFEIVFYNEIVDTTIGNVEEFNIPIKFEVFDIFEGDQLSVVAITDLPNNTVQHRSSITLLKEIDDQLHAICEIEFFQENFVPDEGHILPMSGSSMMVSTSRNFTARDTYRFSIKEAANDKKQAKDQMKDIAVVPDPYIATASWEKQLHFTSGRGERRVDFIHLPPVCTIRIFSLDGKLVRTLKHDSLIEDGHHSWDLTSKDGLDVAPGIYIYHVKASNVGEKMGRFALIK